MVENLKKIIEEHFFFKDFNPEEIEILLKHASLVNFNEGEFLLTTRQEARNFYFILSGSVSLQVFSHEHGIIEFENIQDGEILGWSWLVFPFVYHFDAVAFE